MKPRASAGIDGVSSLNESMSQIDGNFESILGPASDVKFRITSNVQLLETQGVTALPPIFRPTNNLNDLAIF
jgi:hypothetical protein